jgi:hypothetical protein
MKKLVFTAFFVVFLAVGTTVFAQTETRPNPIDDKVSEFYYVNVSVEKVYPYSKGYIVMYRKGYGQFGRVYLPASWFIDASSKGEIITLPQGQAWPSLTVYYRNGQFSFVRLYVHRWANHPTWGSIPQNVNIDDRFENIDTITIEY